MTLLSTLMSSLENLSRGFSNCSNVGIGPNKPKYTLIKNIIKNPKMLKKIIQSVLRNFLNFSSFVLNIEKIIFHYF